MSDSQRHLEALAASEGVSIIGLLEAAVTDSVCPGICIVCGLTAEVEPDQDRGWCESCGRGTVKSALILAGLI